MLCTIAVQQVMPVTPPYSEFQRSGLGPPTTAPTAVPGPHWIDARALCHQVAERLSPRTHRQHVTLEVSVGPGDAPVIGFGPALLDALELLSLNALDGMPDGGRLVLRVTREDCVTIELEHEARTERREPRARQVLRDARAETRVHEARRTIEAHRGRLSFADRPGAPSRAVIELHAAGPARRSSR